MRCHRYKGVFIPGCWGGVLHGKAGCYCYDKPVEDLDAEIVRLQTENMRLQDDNDRLRAELFAILEREDV